MYNFFNPFPPSVLIWHVPFSKNFDFNLRRDRQKKSYERHDCESVDEKSLSYPEERPRKNSGGKELTADFQPLTITDVD